MQIGEGTAVTAECGGETVYMVAEDLGGQAVDSTKIEDYMGFDFITGPELIAKFKDQLVRSRYIAHLIADAEEIERTSGEIVVTASQLKRDTWLSSTKGARW
jgi:alkyl hydroperoxide reductase subunit F